MPLVAVSGILRHHYHGDAKACPTTACAAQPSGGPRPSATALAPGARVGFGKGVKQSTSHASPPTGESGGSSLQPPAMPVITLPVPPQFGHLPPLASVPL